MDVLFTEHSGGGHFGFMQGGYVRTRSRLGAEAYARYWLERIESTREIPRREWPSALERLIAHGVFAAEDIGEFDRRFTSTKRNSASPRPAIRIERQLPSSVASVRSAADEVRSALEEAFVALEEPLDALGGAGGTGAGNDSRQYKVVRLLDELNAARGHGAAIGSLLRHPPRRTVISGPKSLSRPQHGQASAQR
ncbi:MAG: hypothetical protein H0U00_05325 [Actinobacteria bacterium]|nr:hypothetical protein [Actinomycetota bacterium]